MKRAFETPAPAAELPGSDLVAFRRAVHARPETAFEEHETAVRVVAALQATGPDALVEGLGGTGVAAAWDGAAPGPTVLVRCELDALPVTERVDRPHASQHAGRAHACGHDGHMTMVLGLAREVARSKPARGRVVLLFQPAEETGEGAAAVLADPAFAPFEPDWAFAIHNLPGYPLGAVVLRSGPFASASCGLDVTLRGRTAHAGHPEQGCSPAGALATLLETLPALPGRTIPFGRAALVTVVGARLGGRAFGTSPGDAELQATLRAARDDDLSALWERSAAFVDDIARTHGLAATIGRVEPFPATVNDEAAAALVQAAAEDEGLPVVVPPHAFPWSEDFGHVTRRTRAALFGLGAGEDHAPLHAPDYDFPDPLLPIGVRVLRALVDRAVQDPAD